MGRHTPRPRLELTAGSARLRELKDPTLYFNRELSWMEFNRRVLEEAQDLRHPLLERVKFLAIFSSNLDEFFMIRVSGLKDQIAAGVTTPPADGMTPSRAARRDSRPRAADAARAASLLLRGHAAGCSTAAGIHILHYAQLTLEEQDRLRDYFQAEMLPVLTPLAFDPGRPFPHISNLSLNLAVIVRGPTGDQRFARVKVPTSLPRLVPVEPTAARFVWLEDVIAGNLGLLFPGYDVLESLHLPGDPRRRHGNPGG